MADDHVLDVRAEPPARRHALMWRVGPATRADAEDA